MVNVIREYVEEKEYAEEMEYAEKKQYNVMIALNTPLIQVGIERVLEEDGKFFVLKGKSIREFLIETDKVVDILFIDFATFSEHLAQMEQLINEKNVKVVILDDQHQHQQVNVEKLISLNVHGYLDIGMSEESFILAVNEILDGKYYIHPSLTKDLVDGYLDLLNRIHFGESKNDDVDKKNAISPYNITKRELEVVHLIVEGLNNEQMAESLQVSEKTVKNHLSSIFKKLNVNSRTQVAIKAITEKWVSL